MSRKAQGARRIGHLHAIDPHAMHAQPIGVQPGRSPRQIVHPALRAAADGGWIEEHQVCRSALGQDTATGQPEHARRLAGQTMDRRLQ
jgi:hypothetical protein